MSDCQAIGKGTDKFGEPASYGCTLEAPHEPPHIAHGAEGRELLRWPDLCQARIGPWLDGAIPVEESVARAGGCSRPATVTLRGACAHGHAKKKRYCAEHGVVAPPSGAWFCLECAEAGHDCPITPEVVTS